MLFRTFFYLFYIPACVCYQRRQAYHQQSLLQAGQLLLDMNIGNIISKYVAFSLSLWGVAVASELMENLVYKINISLYHYPFGEQRQLSILRQLKLERGLRTLRDNEYCPTPHHRGAISKVRGQSINKKLEKQFNICKN